MSIAQEWSRNPSSRPTVSQNTLDALAGVVEGGANVDYRGNPNVEVRSKSREFLEHLDELLGVFSRGVRQFRGDTMRLRTRPHPRFGDLTVDSPQALRYYYAYAGSVQTSPSVNVILPDNTPDIPQETQQLSVTGPKGNPIHQKILPEEETKRFFKYVGASPVPGCGEKWPAIKTEKPSFDDDSTPMRVDGERVASVKWENRDSEYVMLWYQRLFRVATENGAYSMSAQLRESTPDHIEKIWVADRRKHNLLRFTVSQFHNEAKEIPAGEYAVDEIQYAVDKELAKETYDLPTELH